MRVARYLLSFGTWDRPTDSRSDFGLVGWEIFEMAFPLAVAAPLLRSEVVGPPLASLFLIPRLQNIGIRSGEFCVGKLNVYTYTGQISATYT